MKAKFIIAILVFFATSTMYLGFATIQLAKGNLAWMPDPFAQMEAVKAGK